MCRIARSSLPVFALLVLGASLLTVAAPIPAHAADATALRLNEIRTAPDDSDWIELYNTSDEPVSLAGVTVSAIPFRGESVVVEPEGVVPGHGFRVVPLPVVEGNSHRVFLDFGDDVRVDSESFYEAPATASIGRCPDGEGRFQLTRVATPGAANVCNTVLLNEIEATPETGSPWAELINLGPFAQDLSRTWLANGEQPYELSGTLEPGEIRRFFIDLTDFRMVSYQMIGGRAYDEFWWGGAPATSWGRCPDGAGQPLDNAFVVTEAETPGAPNDCGVEESSTILEVDPTTATYGDAIELTANVAAADGTGTPTGTVTFYAGDTALGTAELDGGAAATTVVDDLTAGSHQVRAEYAGDDSFGGSASDPVTVEVAKATTAITATPAVRLLPLGIGQLQATVTSSSEPLAGAPVEFRVGGTTMCRSTTDAAGVATCNASPHVVAILLARGYTARYEGDANHEAASARGPAL